MRWYVCLSSEFDHLLCYWRNIVRGDSPRKQSVVAVRIRFNKKTNASRNFARPIMAKQAPLRRTVTQSNINWLPHCYYSSQIEPGINSFSNVQIWIAASCRFWIVFTEDELECYMKIISTKFTHFCQSFVCTKKFVQSKLRGKRKSVGYTLVTPRRENYKTYYA